MESKVVKLEPGVERESVVSDGPNSVEESSDIENKSLESVGVKDKGSGVGLGLDGEVRSIVMEGSRNEDVLLNSVGRVMSEKVSVSRVNGNLVGSLCVRGNDKCTFVIVGSAVGQVSVGGRVLSKDVRGGVDAGKSVGVPVGNVVSPPVEGGESGGVKLKGGHLRKPVPNPASSSLMSGDGRWAR